MKVKAKLVDIGKAVVYLESLDSSKLDGFWLGGDKDIWVVGTIEGDTLGEAIINLAKSQGWNP